MNLLRFLKSKRGAIKPLNTLLIAGAASGVFAYTVNTVANKQIEEERAIRTLSAIESTSPRAGMLRDGQVLTSISVRDSRGELATQEDLQNREGKGALGRYMANQKALDNMDYNLGRAFETVDAEGLNVADRQVTIVQSQFAQGNPRTGGNVPSTAHQPGAGGTGTSGASARAGTKEGARLSPATMTRSANGGVSLSGNSGSGSQSSGGATRGGNASAQLSGYMPQGTNAVSQMQLASAKGTRAGNSSFNGGRNGRVNRNRRSGGPSGDEIKNMRMLSRKALANSNASTNEGANAYLADYASSGGVTTDDQTVDVGTSVESEDLAGTHKLLNPVHNRLQQEEEYQDEANAANKVLIWQLIATAIGSIGCIIAAAKILSKMPKGTLAYYLVAATFCAVVIGFNAWLYIRAAKYISNYGAHGGTTIARIAKIVSVLCVGAIVGTVCHPEMWSKTGLKNLWGKFKSRFSFSGLIAGEAEKNLPI